MNTNPLQNQPAAQPEVQRAIRETVDVSDIRVTELLAAIGKHGKLVVLSILAAMMLAAGYLLLAEPVYRSETHLYPPQQQDIQELVIKIRSVAEVVEQKGYIDRYTPDQVYRKMLQNLNSLGLRREFFDSNDLIRFYVAESGKEPVNADHIFDRRFNRNFSIVTESGDTSLTVASFAHSDPELAAKWLNEYVTLANRRTVEQLVSDADVEIKTTAEWVRTRLFRMLNSAQQGRMDQIMQLREALQIAKTLGISDMSTLSVASSTVQHGGVAVNTAELPRYMRGTKALGEEIAVLESRKSEEAFIKGYRDMQNKLKALESIDIDEKLPSSVRVDMPAWVAYRAEKPNKALIIVLGLMLGVMVGILLAFLAEYRYRVRNSS